jgi:hypothetical protein
VSAEPLAPLGLLYRHHHKRDVDTFPRSSHFLSASRPKAKLASGRSGFNAGDGLLIRPLPAAGFRPVFAPFQLL